MKQKEDEFDESLRTGDVKLKTRKLWVLLGERQGTSPNMRQAPERQVQRAYLEAILDDYRRLRPVAQSSSPFLPASTLALRSKIARGTACGSGSRARLRSVGSAQMQRKLLKALNGNLGATKRTRPAPITISGTKQQLPLRVQ